MAMMMMMLVLTVMVMLTTATASELEPDGCMDTRNQVEMCTIITYDFAQWIFDVVSSYLSQS